MKNKILTERAYYFAPNINVVMAVDILGMPQTEQLEAAIWQAVSSHELLCSRIVQDEKGDCFYLPSDRPNLRIETRYLVSKDDWREILFTEQRNPFDLPNGELIRFFILQNETDTKLVLIAHHLAGDGMALTYLIRDIMTALVDESLLFEKKKIYLLDKKDFPSGAKLSRLMRPMVMQLNRKWNKEKKIFNYDDFLKMFNNYWSDHRTGVMSKEVTGESLSKLLAACSAHRVTVNSAIITAFLMASQGNKAGVAASVRPSKFNGMGNYATIITVLYQYNDKSSFWKNAQQVQKVVHGQLNNERKKYFLLSLFKELEPTLIDSTYFSAFGEFNHSASANLCDLFGYRNEKSKKTLGISNLTKADMPVVYGSYTLQNLTFVPPLIFNNKQVIGAVTLNNTMTITMHYQQDGGNQQEIFHAALEILSHCYNK